jgi:hypothetical protein
MIGKRNRSTGIKASCKSAFSRTERERFAQQPPPPEVDVLYLTKDYCGNIVYENDALKYILNPEGYAYQTGNDYHYDYYLRDHLGNNWKVGDQVNNYYPSGMTNLYISFNSERQPYKFGGKELDEMYGLNWYDQGARPFDAIIPSINSNENNL